MAEDLELRLARGADAPWLAAMSRDLVELGLGWSWVPSRIVRHIRAPESVVLVAQCTTRIVGFAVMRFDVEEAHLDLLAVKPAYRRAGVGRKLMAVAGGPWIDPFNPRELVALVFCNKRSVGRIIAAGQHHAATDVEVSLAAVEQSAHSYDARAVKEQLVNFSAQADHAAELQ